MLFNITFRHWNCFLLSVAMDGKDENGLKLENIGPNFSSCNANLNLLAKLTPLPATKKNIYCGWHSLIKFVCYLLHNSAGAFCVGVKVIKRGFQYRINLKQHYPYDIASLKNDTLYNQSINQNLSLFKCQTNIAVEEALNWDTIN